MFDDVHKRNLAALNVRSWFKIGYVPHRTYKYTLSQTAQNANIRCHFLVVLLWRKYSFA